MKLAPLTRGDCEQVRRWRNEALFSLRTPYYLTKEMQEDFYKNVVCNRNSSHRYWAITNPKLIGIGGLTNIGWENRIAEISLIIDPNRQKRGFGEKAVELLLDQAFNYLNLKTVFGECYFSNKAAGFWKKITEKYEGFQTRLPNRKFWDGSYWDSYYFSIDKDKWKRINAEN